MKQPKIVQISAVKGAISFTVFGLGADGKVYYWNDENGKWYLEVEQDETV